MDDALSQGSSFGKSAIQADADGNYKQAYFLYQECLRSYVEALRVEDQDDRIDWTHEQILIRFERLAELNAWYKRKNLLEQDWLLLDDLRDRLETVAPKLGPKLKGLSEQTATAAPPSQKEGPPVSPPTNNVGLPTGTQAPGSAPGGQYGVQPPVAETQKPVAQYALTSPASTTSSTPTSGYPGGPGSQQPLGYPPQPTPSMVQGNQGQYGGPPDPKGDSIVSPGGHNVPPPSALGYNPNGIVSPAQGNQYPPPQGNYPTGSPGPYGNGPGPYQPPINGPPSSYADPNINGNALARVPTNQQQPTFQQQDNRTYLLTPFLRLSLPVKMYHCYGAAQRYRGGAEGWNIEIKDGSKNPIYYLYGLKQANAPLVEMSLHREDGKKTRCMDIYTPLRDGRQSYNVGDMSYKHYLPTPVDVYSQGESPPQGQRRRIFTFNGRRFLWRPDGQGNGTLVNESLYEIDDGPAGYRPSQMNGLLGDGKPLETKLAWYEHTMARKKLGRINVVAGLELAIEEIFLGTILGHLCTSWEQTRKGI